MMRVYVGGGGGVGWGIKSVGGGQQKRSMGGGGGERNFIRSALSVSENTNGKFKSVN